MSPITTHVLDTAKGAPAAGIFVMLEYLYDDGWSQIATGTTNKDGRVPELLPGDHKLQDGVYRLTFKTKDYFAGNGTTHFYPYVPVVFEIKGADQHYHVPLLLSPYGYSTYRGS